MIGDSVGGKVSSDPYLDALDSRFVSRRGGARYDYRPSRWLESRRK